MFNFDSIYLVYLLIGVSAAMFAEGLYLLVFNNASYRKNINRRLKVMDGKTDRESVLVQLRRERGLTSSGDYRLPLVSFNKLLLQSGLTIGFGRLILFIVMGATAIHAALAAARRKDPTNKYVQNNIRLLEESYRKGKAIQ
jgi:tight adherence protein B